ncbi:MAG: hypothetical protein LQ340_003388 [Diploschistes diacapsis]|nr:MAG: hypothetical protein LQ340_003388 [Diploschistes diacapsis]
MPSASLLQVIAQSSGSNQSGDLPPYSSGSLGGTEALLGADGNPFNPLNPVDTAAASDPQYVPEQKESSTPGLYLDFEQADQPQPVRVPQEALILDIVSQVRFLTLLAADAITGNSFYDQQNSDLSAPPDSDADDTSNSKWPMGLSHNRLGLNSAGWARQQNTDVFPAATAIASVDMRLEPHDYANSTGTEPPSGLSSSAFFSSGVPHYIQAGHQRVEFLLIFDQDSFSEGATSLVSEMLLGNPKSVIAKDFRTDQQQLEVDDGSVKILDPQTFPIASSFSLALVTLKPGAMRELHWHLTSDEWDFYLQGRARLTTFSPPQSSRTFDFQTGDVGYVENTGAEDVVFLEGRAGAAVCGYLGRAVARAYAQTMVKDTPGLGEDFIDKKPQYEQLIM